MRKKLLIIGVALVILATTFVYGCGKGVETYNKFGFSFDYPADMEVKEEGFPRFSEEANEEAGVLYLTKPELFISISWVTLESADLSLLLEGQKAYLWGVRTTSDKFYLGGARYSEQHMGHTRIEQRFVTVGDYGTYGNRLNILGTWWCDKSKKVFEIDSGAKWKNATFIMYGDGTIAAEFPDYNHDPSYKAYKELLGSLHCH